MTHLDGFVDAGMTHKCSVANGFSRSSVLRGKHFGTIFSQYLYEVYCVIHAYC